MTSPLSSTKKGMCTQTGGKLKLNIKHDSAVFHSSAISTVTQPRLVHVTEPQTVSPWTPEQTRGT